MAAARLLRVSRPLGLGISRETMSAELRPRTVVCRSKAAQSCENPPGVGGAERKPVVVKATGYELCVVISEPKTDKGIDFSLLLTNVTDLVNRLMRFVSKKRPWGLHIQMTIEKVIIDCRFFTLLAIAGSLLGSVLCFLEGCFLIIESYLQYFRALSQHSEQGNVVFLLMESIDMFLVGTAMLIFGMALHMMFVGSENVKGNSSHHSKSTLSKNFNLKRLQSWMGMDSVMQAKTKIGHALMMILQVEVLEKSKSIPMTNGLDLACFASVLFLSSAAIFVLSKVAFAPAETSG